MQSKIKVYSPTKTFFFIFVTFLLAATAATQPAQAKTKFKVLHAFHGKNGAGPTGQLARDKMGNLYGTASAGGTGKCGNSFDDRCGIAFKLDKNGKQVWLHSFNGENGDQPLAGVLHSGAGNLYGTTYLGGDTNCYTFGCGTLFSLGPDGNEKLLYQFTGTPDGWFPQGPLTRDATGNFYGTTQEGGSSGGYGTVFKVDKAGNETVLYSFTGGSDGCGAYGGVTLDAAGNLFGTTADGGVGFCNSGYGVVFMLDSAGNFSVLHTFEKEDGSNPLSALLLDSTGNLYGATQNGGSSSECGVDGCGTVFKLSPTGNGTWTETVLYNFCSLQNCTDGEFPHASLMRDSSGDLFGTTYSGGRGGDGVVFKITPAGREAVLHSFTGGTDGATPWGGLVRDSAGNLYGTAELGGDTNCFPPTGCGVVFKIMF